MRKEEFRRSIQKQLREEIGKAIRKVSSDLFWYEHPEHNFSDKEMAKILIEELQKAVRIEVRMQINYEKRNKYDKTGMWIGDR